LRAVVVAGGEAPPSGWLARQLEDARLIVCADSGWLACRAAGVLPHLLVGDLDSLPGEVVANLPELVLGVRRYPSNKDRSDLHLALEELALHWQGPVDILGALGGRLDHALFNLCSVLFLAHDLGLQARLIDPITEVYRLGQQPLELRHHQGWHCSILPLSQQLHGVRLRGFLYALDGETLARLETRGLSNRVDQAVASISTEEGEGLVILTRPDQHPC